MTKLRNLLVLLIAIPMASALAQYVEITASGGGRYECRVDGVPVKPKHSTEYAASSRAANLKLANPDSTVICEQNRSLVATLTAAGKALVSDANADVLLGDVDEYPGPTSLIIDEDFSTDPLANDEDPYYDDGVDFDQCSMPSTGSDALCYTWTEGDVGTNGLGAWRAHFLDDQGEYFPQSEFEVRFDYAASTNFDDVNPGNAGTHLFYLRSNLDGQYGSDFTIYIEPDGDCNFWLDINKSDEPATWEEVRQDTNVDTCDGAVHTVRFYMKENTFGNADGIVRLWVDDTLVAEDTGIEIFINENQHVQNISFGPYIVGGSNSATGAVSLYVDNLEVEGLTAAPSAPLNNPGVFQFAQSSYSITEGTGTLSVTVNRGSGSDGGAGVTVTSANGTATAGSDYTAVNQTLSFSDAETSKSFNVTIADDESAEGSENFTLSLSNATGGATVGAVGDTTVTILDSASGDPGSLTVDWPVAPYADDEIRFTVRIAATQAEDVPFDYATSNSGTGDDYAAAGTDYTATSGSSSIPAGSLYKQIVVPIAGNEPPNGRHEFTFTVTDEDENDTVVKGLIVNAIYWQDYDYPTGSSTKQNFYRSNQTGSWANSNIDVKDFSEITSEVPAAVGVNSLKHNLVITDPRCTSGVSSFGCQPVVGLDGGAGNINVGSIFDGEWYYFKWYMRIEPGFDWDGANASVLKHGRFARTNGQLPGYTTFYMEEDGLFWETSYPANDDTRIVSSFDFGSMDDGEWHEIIYATKRESSYGSTNGEIRMVVDCQLEDSDTSISLTETGETQPGDGVTTVRVTAKGFGTWFHQQLGADSGGIIYTDGHMGTKGIWPTAQCARPW